MFKEKKNCTENQNKHFMLNFFFENFAIYETMWRNYKYGPTTCTVLCY